MKRGDKNKQHKADPSQGVTHSRLCRCFGYVSCKECAKDCCVDCNMFSLCCDCTRFLQGTCQCVKDIGCVECMEKKLHCNAACVAQTCKQDSPLCIIICHGLGIMLLAGLALCFALYFAVAYGERVFAAIDSPTEYSCNKQNA